MLLFTVGAGKKPGNSGTRSRRPLQRGRILNDYYLLQNLGK